MKRLVPPLVLLGPALTWLGLFLVLPLALILVYSFFQRGAFGQIVPQLTLANYSRLFNPTVLKVFLNSLRIASLVTGLALLLGYPTAYFITHQPSRWKNTLLVLVILPFWTSYLIRTYAWIVLLNREGVLSRLLIAVGLSKEPISFLYNDTAIFIGLLYGYLPFMVLPLYSAIERLNPELREAAFDLGATPLKTFLQVTLPLTIRGVVTGAIFVFVPSLGNFFVPELLGGGQRFMIGNMINNQFLKARDWPYGSAMAFGVMAIVLMLLLFQAWVTRRTEEG
ncbi:MAG: Spermidine Putrescine ABC transporter permease component PotB [Anaerolineae bacterium]|jgi:spermidine/putrescine transport system permease protein|nr:MAG: Spermidine Putrescine ABC transporter permease component PotB [Anaerolineae bacterium]